MAAERGVRGERWQQLAFGDVVPNYLAQPATEPHRPAAGTAAPELHLRREAEPDCTVREGAVVYLQGRGRGWVTENTVPAVDTGEVVEHLHLFAPAQPALLYRDARHWRDTGLTPFTTYMKNVTRSR